jgi:hypothetical protein
MESSYEKYTQTLRELERQVAKALEDIENLRDELATNADEIRAHLGHPAVSAVLAPRVSRLRLYKRKKGHPWPKVVVIHLDEQVYRIKFEKYKFTRQDQEIEIRYHGKLDWWVGIQEVLGRYQIDYARIIAEIKPLFELPQRDIEALVMAVLVFYKK